MRPDIFDDAGPRWPGVHFFSTDRGAHLFAANGSRVYDLDEEAAAEARAMWADSGEAQDSAFLARHGISAPPYIGEEPLDDPPLRSISLAVAQACNLGCSYCYAQGGSFGGPPRMMSWSVAQASVDRLLEASAPRERVNIAFLGGEPLANRPLVRQVVEYAARRSCDAGVRATFAITTNGTLVDAADVAFFDEHRFSVTVSLDGIGDTHDRLRPFKDGSGSYARIVERIAPLLRRPRGDGAQVSARVTVTPRNLSLLATLDGLIALGFDSVGFAPMLTAPRDAAGSQAVAGRDELDAPALREMLAAMIACGREYEQRVMAGERYPFSNMDTAMQELHRGTHRPYPCGAGASYLGVGASGDLFACHRFVDGEAGRFGSVSSGVDRTRQVLWLAERHVDRQEPCRSCWARYLCGGGCHHEVIQRGRVACDYIRGWLHYCLTAYVRLLDARPDLFDRPPGTPTAGVR
jgi:uncharacterized protein